MMKHDLPWSLPLETLRAASWRPRAAPHERAAILLTPPSLHVNPALTSLATLLKREAAEDIVLTLDVAQLLADRCSPSRAMLRALFTQSKAEHWLAWLRQRVPPGLQGRSWLYQSTDLSQPGAARVAAALGQGDFGALDALLAYDNPIPSHQDGEIHVELEEPLAEQDARALLTFLLRSLRPPRRACWVLLRGLEACLCGGGRLANGFRSGLQAWWRQMQRLDGVILLSSCWSEARDLLGSVDRSLKRLCRSPEDERGAPQRQAPVHGVAPALSPALQGPDPASICAGLSRGLNLGAPQPLEGGDVWLLLGDGRRVLLVWPCQARHPARRALRVVADVVEALPGHGPVLVLIPDWAGGRGAALSRSALRRAFPVLRWELLPTSAAYALCEFTSLEPAWWRAIDAMWADEAA